MARTASPKRLPDSNGIPPLPLPDECPAAGADPISADTSSDAPSALSLIRLYNECNPLEQRILQVFAIFAGHATKTALLHTLKDLETRTEERKCYSFKILNPVYTLLTQKGLLTENNNQHYLVPPLILPICLQLKEQGRLNQTIKAVRNVVDSMTMDTEYRKNAIDKDLDVLSREIFLSLLEEKSDLVQKLLDHHRQFQPSYEKYGDPVLDLFRRIPGVQRLADDLDSHTRICIADHLADPILDQGTPPDPAAISIISKACEIPDLPPASREQYLVVLAEIALFKGDLDRLASIASQASPMNRSALTGTIAFLKGDNATALEAFDEAMAQLKKQSRKRNLLLPHLSGVFHILTLIETGAGASMETARRLTGFGIKQKKGLPTSIFHLLSMFISSRTSQPDATAMLLYSSSSRIASSGPAGLLFFLILHWNREVEDDNRLFIHMEPFISSLESRGFDWLRAEAEILHHAFHPETAPPPDLAFFEKRGIRPLADMFPPEEEWIKTLNALEEIANPAAVETKKTDKAPSRVIWHIETMPSHTGFSLTPRLLTRTKSGSWSKGRNIALQRLRKEPETVDGLTDQDRRVCANIREITYYYGSTSWDFQDEAILDLVGHPHIYLASEPNTRIDLIEGRPGLSLTETSDGQIRLTFSHRLDPDMKIQVIRESADRLMAVRMDTQLARLARLVKSGVTIPAEGRDRLMEISNRLAGVAPLASEMDGVGKDARTVDADSTPVVRLRPLGEGLRAELQVQPFTDGGPSLSPGEGGDTLICRIGGMTDGESLRTTRDKDEEVRRANAVLAACPALTASGADTDIFWIRDLPLPEDSLELLLQLHSLEDEVRLLWPEGEALRIRKEADLPHLSLRIQRETDWFSVSGELAVDESEVVTMAELLALMENSHGRFIRLKSGEFMALTNRFRRHLEDIADWSEAAGKKGETRKFHPLAALMLEDMTGEAGHFSADKSWKEQVKRLADARSLQPVVPSTFKGQLRDYQEEGFAWLARLARLGAGACLADDMGLGKTIQALSLILTRTAKGPTLVVAPVSVCMNWETEAARFAPTLRVRQLGVGDRESVVSDLGPFDLLLVSYGLLQQDSVANLLTGVSFEIIVLDEAQAIKNAGTKRSRAAMGLQGNFRVITTGTPVENHLGELWNLFRFLNPGLLGSSESFSRRFAVPIERDGDRRVRRRLKRLIQPFLLRRTKDQVLEELPERTDILLKVDLSDGETAFYEALRRNALERLAEGEDGGPMMVLAEIMKLRRACCHPSLASPGLDLPGAKLAVFENLVDDLLAGGHKALVFSQFTDHLAIIREKIEEKGISYQYLDGSTPARKRKERVDKFQAGDGDLFLISLKAGGTGLNLTAADYVIHMDPWWNPAVEDQASDRAHRIGQDRPVTVYSLVARHTIEEKIVALHRDKRDLADSLLDGADVSGKMTAEELMALIREG